MKNFFGISSFQVLVMFRRGLFYGYLTIYLKHYLGLGVTETTLFATLPMIVNVGFQRYVWGKISDRHQKRRTLIIIGEILGGTGLILLWFGHLIPESKTQAGWVIIIGLTLIEVVWSMSNIGWSALISDIWGPGERSLIMARLEGMGGIGRVAGLLAGGLFYDGMGLEFPGWGFESGLLFFITGGVMFLSVLPILSAPEGGIGRREGPDAEKQEDERFSALHFSIFIAGISLINFGRNSVIITMAQYLTLESGFNLSAIALSHISNFRSAGIIIMGFTFSLFFSRTDPRTAVTLGALGTTVSLVMTGTARLLPTLAAAGLLTGLSEVVIMAASYELASSYIPASKRAQLFSIFNATYFLSFGLAGTFIAGPVTDFLIMAGKPEGFAYRMSFLTAAGISLSGVLILGLLFRMEKNGPAR